jgi:hypothetical protein
MRFTISLRNRITIRDRDFQLLAATSSVIS